MSHEDLLVSWNDTATRAAVVDFVGRVTGEGPEAVPPEERIAVFDNDGTLWTEKPMPVQMWFILHHLARMAEQDESLRIRDPWRAAYEKDYAWLASVMDKHYAGDDSLVKVLMTGILTALAGHTVEEYERAAITFLQDAPHPTLGRRLRDCGYQPMVELLRYLEANGFTNYIASGGDRDFMRPVAEEIYGIPPERVVGSSNALSFVDDDEPQLVFLAAARRLRRRPHQADPDLEPCRPASSACLRQLQRRHPDAAVRGGPAGRRCGCWSATTTPTGSSTPTPEPRTRSTPLRQEAGPWSASRTTGARSSPTNRGGLSPGAPGDAWTSPAHGGAFPRPGAAVSPSWAWSAPGRGAAGPAPRAAGRRAGHARRPGCGAATGARRR